MTEKIKLTGGLDKTVTWIWLDPAGGQLNDEYYDFDESAQNMFGNDIAYTITINEMDKLFLTAKQNENTVILWLTENFKSYFGINQWLEQNELNLVLKEKAGLKYELP